MTGGDDKGWAVMTKDGQQQQRMGSNNKCRAQDTSFDVFWAFGMFFK
jgi:hypothetical protein